MLVLINTTLVYLCLLRRIILRRGPHGPLTSAWAGDVCPGLTISSAIGVTSEFTTDCFNRLVETLRLFPPFAMYVLVLVSNSICILLPNRVVLRRRYVPDYVAFKNMHKNMCFLKKSKPLAKQHVIFKTANFLNYVLWFILCFKNKSYIMFYVRLCM